MMRVARPSSCATDAADAAAAAGRAVWVSAVTAMSPVTANKLGPM
eukprot:CAMPEP_0170869412 /NCGR_PEP_ID=MMETSP0734-20130129/24295_1 /TAXON_ID=186038 /ORGANISM="Fragilariopsis kerguelensis, Strain L26-C5" /LENGTH=44 /DNA_ID= /DNA_START= /DNA_END= /DNA_ORIENTATION=